MNKIELKSIHNLLGTKSLRIPSYQRPYKWNEKNIEELLSDIDIALGKKQESGNSNFRYRIGTILLHNNTEDKTLDVIDGQQRITTLMILFNVLVKTFPEITSNIK